MSPILSSELAGCLMLLVLIALQSSSPAEAKKAKPTCLPALISPDGPICADGMAFDQEKQLCCKSRRAREAPCFPATKSPRGDPEYLCADGMVVDQAKCCKPRRAGTAACLPATKSPLGDVCPDGMEADPAKCCKPRRAGTATCLPSTSSSIGELCPDGMAFEPSWHLCCDIGKEVPQAGHVKGKEGQ